MSTLVTVADSPISVTIGGTVVAQLASGVSVTIDEPDIGVCVIEGVSVVDGITIQAPESPAVAVSQSQETIVVSDGLLIGTQFALPQSVTLAYDGSGNLESVTTVDTAHIVTLAYDGSGRLETTFDTQTGLTSTLAYDGAGRLLSVTIS